MGDKIKVYISSFKGISALDYVDQKSMGHPCVTSEHSENIYTGLKDLPTGIQHGYLSEDQRRTVETVKEFCNENELEYEIVDITDLGSIGKMKLLLKKIKAPVITFRGKRIEGAPTKEDLNVLIAESNVH